MGKTILITGSTDGIGLETAKVLTSLGHRVLLHGRNPSKLEKAKQALSDLSGGDLPSGGPIEGHLADLSSMAEVEALARAVADTHDRLDVLINNAGVYNTPKPITADGLDVRFAVNTLAPYLLTRRLLPRLGTSGRVVNLSSAAQAPVDTQALAGKVRLSDGEAYAQSKLALTLWSRSLGLELGDRGPVIVAVNPGSFLGTKMVKQAFGMAGHDIRIGADILRRAALDDEFEGASGRYFDNDSKRFASPHPEALDARKSEEVIRVLEALLEA